MDVWQDLVDLEKKQQKKKRLNRFSPFIWLLCHFNSAIFLIRFPYEKTEPILKLEDPLKNALIMCFLILVSKINVFFNNFYIVAANNNWISKNSTFIVHS